MLDNIGIDEREVNTLFKKIKGLKKLHKTQHKFQPLIPMTLKSGFTDMTGEGIANENNDINDFTTYKRVFTGQNTAIAQWDKSLVLKNDGKGNITREFQMGDVHWAIGYSMNSAGEISQFTQSDIYTELHDIENITLLIPAEEFREDTHYKVYMLPRLTQRLLRITNVTRYYDTNGKVAYSEVQLSSFNDQISSTGVATTNYVQRHGVGEPYSHPVWKEDTNELSFEVRGTSSVDGIQIELIGNLVLSSLFCFGRVADKDKINPPKPLILHKTMAPSITPLVKAGNPERNLKLLRDASFSLQEGWDKWQSKITAQFDLTQNKWYQGMLKFDLAKTQATDVENVPADVYKNYKVKAPIPLDEYGSPFMHEYAKEITKDQEVSLGNMLSLFGLTQMHLIQLSMGSEQHIPFSLRSIPIIGNILSGLTLGYPIGTDISRITKKGTKFQGFMANGVYQLLHDAKYSALGLMDAGEFDNTTDNPVGNQFGSKATRVALRFSLSDKFSVNYQKLGNDWQNVAGIETDTEWLGVSTEWDHNSTTLDTPNKFEIDKTIAHIFGKGEYILSFFDGDNKMYTARYITTAKLIDDMKQIGNEVKHNSTSNLPIDGGMTGVNWNNYNKMAELMTQDMKLRISGDGVYVHKSVFEKYKYIKVVSGVRPVFVANEKVAIVKGGETWWRKQYSDVVELRVLAKAEGEYYSIQYSGLQREFGHAEEKAIIFLTQN